MSRLSQNVTAVMQQLGQAGANRRLIFNLSRQVVVQIAQQVSTAALLTGRRTFCLT